MKIQLLFFGIAKDLIGENSINFELNTPETVDNLKEILIATAREDVARMIEQTAIVQAARDEAQRILDEARVLAADERAEVESYIDGRLATLEVILNKTMDAVARGRERLDGANDKDVLSQLADDK